MSTRETVTIKTKDDRLKIARWAHQTADGTVVTFRKKSRSTEQSAKMWAMLGEVASQVDWYGQKLDAEAWKDVFTASLRHARVVPGIDKGTFVPLGMHTSTMTIEEMTNLIELIYAFGAEHNVVFKDPKEADTNSGSPSPEADDAPLPSSAEPEAAPASGSPIIECAKEMLSLAVLFYESDKDRDEALSQCLEQWEAKLPDQRALTDHIAVAATAVATGRRTMEQAMPFLAGKLGCTAADIGGEANGV